MPIIKYSTLKTLKNTTNIILKKEFPRLQIDLLQQKEDDYFIDITEAENDRLHSIAEQCSECKKKFPCLCLSDDIDAYIETQKKLNQVFQSLDLLKKSPFRQSRNAFGFMTSTAGFLNLMCSLLTLPAALTCGLVFLPAMALGYYIYRRGKTEETLINRDYEVKLLDEKIKIIALFKEKIKLKKANLKATPTEKPVIDPTPLPYEKIQPFNEKRWILGNAISHCLVPMCATIGITMSFLKFGLLTALLGASGPVGWGIAIGAGICVGSYFAYKRYKNLTHKKTLETCLYKLEQNKKVLESQNNGLRNDNIILKNKNTYLQILTSNPEFKINYCKKITKSVVNTSEKISQNSPIIISNDAVISNATPTFQNNKNNVASNDAQRLLRSVSFPN
ncbi:MAG: hypothetical protein JO131_08705 [Gammaproteobacteria bacterium]|nr:hypothetical protein [Gammaproteobacteria bacterium]